MLANMNEIGVGSGHGCGEPVGVRGFLQVLQLAAPEAPPGAAHHGTLGGARQVGRYAFLRYTEQLLT